MGSGTSEIAPGAEEFDVTELAAAIANLNGEKPPVGRRTVPASIVSSITTRLKEEEAEAAEKEIENAKAGDLMTDGTTYLGRFKDADGTEKHWLAAARDVQDEDDEGYNACLFFNQAAAGAKNSNDHGHNDWIVPPGLNDSAGRPDILSAMFNSRSAGAFENSYNETAMSCTNWYWSSSFDADNRSLDVKIMDFSNGNVYSANTATTGSALRLVRSIPVKEKHDGP